VDSSILLTLTLGLAAAALAALYVAARRAVTIAELEIERGAVRVVRGGIAPPILADLRDVAKRPPIDGLHVRILRSSGRAEVQFLGNVTEEQAQRIRNVVGRVPLARLVNAPKRR
jgi:Protein of unknown function (DUF3634)